MPKHSLGLMLTVLFLGLVFVLPVVLPRAPSTVPSYSQAAVISPKIDPTLIEELPCWFDIPSDWPATECGTLHVPEDHLRPGPRMVQLPFVIFRSTNPEPGSVPVVVTGGGGPGGPLGIGHNSVRPIDHSLWAPFSRMSLFGGRDLILVDNRGVGSSVPRLDCPEFENVVIELIQMDATEAEEQSAIRAGFASCRLRLTETEGIDISKYNVVQAAHDLDALRRGLGFDSINLYGVSYGTSVALVYAREFPNATRALVLDSVAPPHIKFLEELPKLSWRAFERVFEMCADDESCRTRFGDDLQERFETFLGNLDDGFLDLTITHPRTLEPLPLKVGSGLIVSSLYLSMYAGTEIQKVPLILHTLMNNSFDYLGEVVRETNIKLAFWRSLDEGAYASYSCYDEIPFNDAGYALQEVEKYPIQKSMNRPAIIAGFAMCDVWNVPAGDPVEAAPVRSPVPTLLLSGALDPVTPPEWAAELLQYLPRAYHVVWPGISHGVLSASFCADEMAQKFLDQPDRDPTGINCIYDPQAPFQFSLN